MLTTKKTFGIMALNTLTGRTVYVQSVQGPKLATRNKADAMVMSLVEARMLLRGIIAMDDADDLANMEWFIVDLNGE